MDNRQRRRMSLSSLIGWLIFILVLAGGPIVQLIGRALNGTVNLPANLPMLLIGGLVVLSILVSVLRAVGSNVQRRSDTRLPTVPSTPARPMNAPMPPFGGPAGRTISTQSMPQRPARERLPSTPQFDPLINPRIVGIAVVGLLVLGGLVLLVVVGNVL